LSNVLQEFLNQLPSHFEKKPESNNYKLLSIVADQAKNRQELLNTIQRFRDVDQAEGKALDRLGKDEGLSRGSYDDSIYRKLIKIQYIVNLSEGEIEDMNTVLRAYMDDGFLGVQELWNHRFYEEIAAFKVNYDFYYEGDVPKSTLRRMKPAGVRAFWAAFARFPFERSLVHAFNIRIHIKNRSNPWAQSGSAGAGSEALFLDGKYKLDGEVFLNSYTQNSGPAHLPEIRIEMKNVHEFGVHEMNLSPVLDGTYRLDGEIRLQSEPQLVRLAVLQSSKTRIKQREVIQLAPAQRAPVLIQHNARSGVITLNGTVTLDGSTNLDQSLCDHPGVLRVKKSGTIVEEVAV
jgi:hypothetical protein